MSVIFNSATSARRERAIETEAARLDRAIARVSKASARLLQVRDARSVCELSMLSAHIEGALQAIEAPERMERVP